MQKKYSILLMVGITMFLASCSSEKEAPYVDAVPRETYVVGSGQITSNDSYLGYVEGIEQSNVGAKIGGRVTTINAKEGDRVKAGQVLALLDGAESKEGYQSAANILGNTQSVYANTSELFDAQIATAQEKIAQAEQAMAIANDAAKGNATGLDDTKNGLQEQLLAASKQVEQAQIAADTAQNQYDNVKATLDQKEQDIYTNAVNGISTADILVGNILTYTDKILGVSDANKQANDMFEPYLGANDQNSKNDSETAWKNANDAYITWKSSAKIASTIATSTPEGKAQMKEILQSTQSLLEKIRILSANLSDCLDHSIASSRFPQTTIDSLKSQLSTFRNNIEQTLLSVSGNYIIGIRGSLQSIDTLKNERNTQLTLLQRQVDLAGKTLEVARQNYAQYDAAAKGKINATTTQKSIAEKQYELTKRQHEEALAAVNALRKQKETQLSLIQTQLAQIQGTKDMAGISVSNNTIVAPFDGVIVAKTASVGQVVGAGLPLFVIAKDDTVKIKVFVGQSKIEKVKIGDSVKIKTDSTGTGVIDGNIKTIQPIADVVSKKIPVEIWVKNADRKLILGMYTNVLFGGDMISGKVVPYRFIEYVYGEPNLNIVLPDGKIQKRIIKTTVCSDVDCIVDGQVKEGEKIILP